MNKGIIEVSADALMDLLKIQDFRLADAQFDGRSKISLVVEHDALPPTASGCSLPSVRPMYRRVDGQTSQRTRVDVWDPGMLKYRTLIEDLPEDKGAKK